MSLSHHIESESNNSLSNSGSGSIRNCDVQIENTPNGFHEDVKKIWTSNFQGFRSTLYRVPITLEVLSDFQPILDFHEDIKFYFNIQPRFEKFVHNNLSGFSSQFSK